MIVFLLLIALVIAGALAALGVRFEIAKPAWGLFGLGLFGAILFMIGIERVEATVIGQDSLPLLPILGGLAMLVATLGLLVLGILWAWRRWLRYLGEGPK